MKCGESPDEGLDLENPYVAPNIEVTRRYDHAATVHLEGRHQFWYGFHPIKLYTATENKDIRFVTLHDECKSRLRQKRFCPNCEVDVTTAETLKGYEYTKDQHVVMEEADFANLPVASVHTIEITRFVDLTDIDPVYFERSYTLEPEALGAKPFYLLKRTLENTNRVAIAKVSLRQK